MELFESYAFTNRNSGVALSGHVAGNNIVSQSFTGTGYSLEEAKLKLYNFGGTTGNAYSKVYAITGTYGTDSHPTATALATSDAFDVSTISAGWETATFEYSSPVTLSKGVQYAVTVESTNGDGIATYVSVGCDTTASTHDGNLAQYSTSWGTGFGGDLVFELYGTYQPPYKTSPISATITSDGLDIEIFLIKDE